MENGLTTEEMAKRLVWYEQKFGPYIEKRGLQNWRNLFKKPSMNDWITLILIIGAVLLGIAYASDHQTCVMAINYWNQMHAPIPGFVNNLPSLNISGLSGGFNGTG